MDEISDDEKRAVEVGRLAPRGECSTCDRERHNPWGHFPRHKASNRCQSNKYPHCTCDICW